MYTIAKMERGAYRIVVGPFATVEQAQAYLMQTKLPVPTYQVVDLNFPQAVAA